MQDIDCVCVHQSLSFESNAEHLTEERFHRLHERGPVTYKQ